MTNKYSHKHNERLSASEARFAAQRLAFGPLVFHATLALRDLGILAALMQSDDTGATVEEIAKQLSLSPYAVTVLLESGLGAELVSHDTDRFYLSKIGYFVLHDEMTRVNLNFVRDICYRGAADLVASLREGRPAGLRHLGEWDNIYAGISSLAEPARSSWFEFDHYYSSSAFPEALRLVFDRPVESLLDIGGNTGKWAVLCAKYTPKARIVIVDDGPQIAQALARAESAGVASQITGYAVNLLDHEQALPGNQDIVWMSQVLSCFAESDIVPLLERAAAALKPNGQLLILETLWDRQKYLGAAYNLQQTSLYFTVIANGVSRIYNFRTLERCISQAGLRIDEVKDGLGISHTLLRCSRSREERQVSG